MQDHSLRVTSAMEAHCSQRNYFSFPTPKRRLDGGSTRVRHAARIPSHARQPGDALPKARALHSKGA